MHYITKMNDKVNMDSTIAWSVHVFKQNNSCDMEQLDFNTFASL